MTWPARKPFAERQLKRWSAQWEKSKTRDVPDVDRLAEILHRNIPEQNEVTLVHGDFHLNNVITDPAEGRIVCRRRLGAVHVGGAARGSRCATRVLAGSR